MELSEGVGPVTAGPVTFQKNNIIPTDKHGGSGSVVVWAIWI